MHGLLLLIIIFFNHTSVLLQGAQHKMVCYCGVSSHDLHTVCLVSLTAAVLTALKTVFAVFSCSIITNIGLFTLILVLKKINIEAFVT